MAAEDPWKTRSDEEEADDLFFEEEGDQERKGKREEAQKELTNAGMLLVSGSKWKTQLEETLNEACKDEATLALDDTIFESVEKASKATCLVRRQKNSQSRLDYYKERGDEERLKNAKKGKGGCGTGFLVHPRSILGWFVITNNHVIMNEEEAESAEVIFDHSNDEHLPDKTKRIKVKQLVSKGIRTTDAEDFDNLDFSVLALESEDEFLEKYAGECLFDENDTKKIFTILTSSVLNFVPIIAFSHPHGLGKRISIGKYPNEDKESEPVPKFHLRHQLPTAPGSSGANLIYPRPAGSDKFALWDAAFVHYRHSLAVSWRVIAPELRKDLSAAE